MTIAYTLATDVLLLTGGTSGTNLTPSNVVSDATTYSAASTYVIGAIVKQDNGDGIGVSLWRCSTAITVAEAWTYAKWTRIAWIANKTIRLTAALDIGAYYTDTGWQYETTKMVRTAAGVKWTSGSVDSTSQLIGFRMNHSGSYTGTGWSLFNGGGATDFVNWTRCEIYKASTNRADLSLSNSALPVTIRNLTIDGRTGFGDNHNMALSAASDVDSINFYYCNLSIAPNANLKNIGHLGLFIESPQNKIGVTVAGSILKNYSPSLPTDLSRLVGLVSAAANQYLQDIAVPAGFLLSTVQAYYASTSAYFTRAVAFTFKQGASLLGSVYVCGYKTGSQTTQIYTGTSNGTTGIFTAISQVFYGNRAGSAGGSYIALQNTIDWTDQTALFRRLDLEEASYQQDMNVNGITLTQFMSTDVYNTVSVPATVAAYPITISGTTITATGAASLHNIYDYAKYWLTQNMAVANFMSASGTTMAVGSYNIAGLELLTPSTKLTAVQTTGSITAAGAFSVDVEGNVTQDTPTALTGVTITGDLTYNTNSTLTVVFTDCAVTGTVSNSGAGVVTIKLINSSVGTAGSNVTLDSSIDTTITAPSLLAGTTVQLLDKTNNILLEEVVTTILGYSFSKSWTSDITLELRYSKIGYEPGISLGTFTSSGASFLDVQDSDAVYNANGIDGSTCPEFSADYPNLQVDLSDVDGQTTVQRIYAWYRWIETSFDGLAYFLGGITATDSVNYLINVDVIDLKLDNVLSTPVIVSGGNMTRSDGTTIIAATSGSIQMDPNKAYVANSASILAAIDAKPTAAANAAAVWTYSTDDMVTPGSAGSRLVKVLTTGTFIALK